MPNKNPHISIFRDFGDRYNILNGTTCFFGRYSIRYEIHPQQCKKDQNRSINTEQLKF